MNGDGTTTTPLSGDDAIWMRAMIRALHSRDVRPERIGEAVAYVEEICATTRSSPASQFGGPAAFARRLEFPIRPIQASPGHEMASLLGATRVHYLGIVLVAVGVLGALGAAVVGGAMRDDDPRVTVPLGAFVIAARALALVTGLTRVPAHFLHRHAAAFIIGLGGAMVALVLAGVFLPLPAPAVPTPLFAALTIVVCVATLLGFIGSAIALRRGRDRRLASQLAQVGVMLAGLQVLMFVLIRLGV